MTQQPLEQPKNPYTQEEIEKIIRLLDSWCHVSEEEAHEQTETMQYLMKVLDEDRPSYRKLFS